MPESVFKPTTAGKAAILLTLTTFFSYVIGLFRDRVIARHFGTSDITDAYNAAFLIPDFIFNFFIAGALSAAFLPVFSDYLNREKQEAFKIANSVLTGIAALVVGLSMAAYILLPEIIPALFSEATPQIQIGIIKMTRLMLLSGIFFAISNTLGNILMSYKHFLSYSLAPIFYNLGIIGGILLLEEKFGIYSAAIGVVVGAGLHLLIRLMDTTKTDYKYQPQLDTKHPGFKKIIRLMIPKSISLIAWQVNLLLFAKVGIGMMEGSWSAFNYARNIQSFAVSLFGIAIATAIFPYLTDTVSSNNGRDYTSHIQKTLQKILFFTIPAAAGLMMLTRPIVELILGGGAFGESSIELTTLLLFFFAMSIPFESIAQILARAFYARQNTLTPMLINISTMAIIASITYFIAPKFGIQWFTIGFTIGFVFQVVASLIFLRKNLQGFNFKEFFSSCSRTIFATAIMLAIIAISEPLETIMRLKIAHMLRIIIGTSSFFLIAWLLKSPETAALKNLIHRTDHQSGT